jgi:hypothetical protein
MCRHRTPHIIVHGRDSLNFLLVEVPFVLYTECAGASPYVGENGALHPPPAWFCLPAPFQVEVVFDRHLVSENLLL